MANIQAGSYGLDVAKLQTLLNTSVTPRPRLSVDGRFGPMTEKAVKRFQQQHHLAIDGIVGPMTWKALGQQAIPTASSRPMPPEASSAKWMSIAAAELGVHENSLPGRNHPRIIEYHSTTSLRATNDETAWCSSFVNWVMIQAGYHGTNSAAARSWLDWGTSLTTPRVGAITVIKKKHPGSDAATGSTSGFHVGFYVSGSSSMVRLLGGNQSDQVKQSNFMLQGYEIKGFRWPT